MRAAWLVLLLAPLARAELASDVKRAFRADDPAERAVALRSAAGGIADADERARNKAAAEIEKALRKEPAPPVRMAALDLLLALRTSRSLDRLVAGALDPAPEVVDHVAEIVRDHADPALLDAIVRALREDASWRMRTSMVDLLLAGAREHAFPPLLDALADPHPAVASRAAEALFRMTGQGFGLDRARWEAWLAKRREEQAQREAERRTTAETRKVDLVDGPVRGVVPTLYTIPILEKRVVFVVDMSSSMQKSARSTHFVELKRALLGLPSDVSFNVLCFDQRLFFFTGAGNAKDLVPATTANKAECERWINDLPAGEKTDVMKSLTAGLAMLNEALKAEDGSKAELFILTDGQETQRTTSLQAVERQYEKLPQDRCRIHVISLGRHGTPALRVLAEASGGHFVEAPAR